jgi:hypothetical protein
MDNLFTFEPNQKNNPHKKYEDKALRRLLNALSCNKYCSQTLQPLIEVWSIKLDFILISLLSQPVPVLAFVIIPKKALSLKVTRLVLKDFDQSK